MQIISKNLWTRAFSRWYLSLVFVYTVHTCVFPSFAYIFQIFYINCLLLFLFALVSAKRRQSKKNWKKTRKVMEGLKWKTKCASKMKLFNLTRWSVFSENTHIRLKISPWSLFLMRTMYATESTSHAMYIVYNVAEMLVRTKWHVNRWNTSKA